LASQSNRYREFIEQCKKQLDARDLLESLGAMNIIESGDELIHSCLIDTVVPHHEHGDSNPSASLNKTKFTYNCFSWGGGSLLWLFKILTQSKNTDQAVEVLSTYLAGDHDQSYEQVQSKIKELFADDELPEPIPHYNSSMLDAWKFIHPWLVEDRGISPRVLVRHKVGYDQTTNTVIIPHFWEKRLVGWQRRRMDSPRWFQLDNVLSKPKYQSSPSFPKYHTLYNYPQPVNSILVVESPMSVLAWETLRECYDDSLPPAVATFGSGVSEKHAELLRTFDTVTVFFDHDFAGWRGALKLLSMIIDHIKCFVVFDPPENKDPAELTGREARFCIDWAVPGPLAIPILEQRVHIKHNSPQKKEK
jgi:hypothetical protein